MLNIEGLDVFQQTLSLAGAGLILIGYTGNHRGLIGPKDRSYAALNLVGSLLLLWVAIVDWRWGFILLETAWALISIPPLVSPKKPS